MEMGKIFSLDYNNSEQLLKSWPEKFSLIPDAFSDVKSCP